MSISRHGAKLCSLGLAILVVSACGDGSPETASPTAGSSSAISNVAPTISGKPASAALTDAQYSFVPQAADPDGDVVTFRIANKPGWATFSAATGQLSGTPRAVDLGEHKGIVISVTDGAAETALGAFSIQVTDLGNGSATLSWEPPTENTDGTPLTDLAGYKIYYGTSPGVYSNTVQIDTPGLTAYVVDNLVPATYYFVATAFNAAGVESETSNVASSDVL